MPHCTFCGSDLQPGHAFCPKCGTKVVITQTPIPDPVKPTTTSSSTAPAPTTSVTTTTTFRGGENILERGSFWGGALVLVGFFLTWIDLKSSASASGLQMFLDCVESFNKAGEKKYVLIIMGIALAVMVIGGLICFLHSIGVDNAKSFNDFKYAPLIAIIAMAVLMYIEITSATRGLSKDWSQIFKVLGVGFYMSLGGAIVLANSDANK